MFNKKLTGFLGVENDSIEEKVSIINELSNVYEKLKHYPGKHNQHDHAWNAGLVLVSKKRAPKNSPLYSMRRNKFNEKRVDRKLNGGVNSPFEAARTAASQGRQLSASDPVKLVAAVTKASDMLRRWADKFRSALAINDEKLKKEVVAEFKNLSKELSAIAESLSNDSVAQNIFKAIIQSYQDTLAFVTPEIKNVIKDDSLTDKNIPDAAIATRVGNEIDKAAKVGNK